MILCSGSGGPAMHGSGVPGCSQKRSQSPGFTLQQIPRLEALWRRTGKIPTLRAKRLMCIPALELPPGLHMLLSLNGRKLRLLRPGRNVFSPELLLLPGDHLRFDFYPGDRSLRPTTPKTLTAHDDQLPTEADILYAAFGDAHSATPPARAIPFANLARFQRQQRGLIGRLFSSLTEGGRR